MRKDHDAVTDNRPKCSATGGKTIFYTSAEAEEALAHVKDRRAKGISLLEDPKSEVRIHPCFSCGGWHMTSEVDPPSERLSRGRRRRPNQRRRR